jgi:uncharacterized hydrophobic protein (TIGR00341 family)
MDERLIVVTAEPGYADTIVAMAEQAGILDCAVFPTEGEPPRESVHLLVSADRRQKVLDKLQSILGSAENWRIAILPVEATIPRIEEEEQDKAARADAKEAAGESREELYNDVAHNARVDANFLVFVALSTVVAAIGLIENNVAVVIGAMVIAPLLGPNLAFCLGVALGDRALMGKAALSNAAGVALTLGLCIVIGLLWPIDMESKELLARTEVGFDSIALALASGAAAALSLVAGLSAALVGVMVAVALLPPAAVLGLMIGAGEGQLAAGAATLLAVNLVCLNLSSQITFVARGVRPRTRFEKEAARRAVMINAAVWLLLLAALAALVYFRAIEVPAKL